MEIGKKKLRKDGSAVDLWGEYGKRFTNGHKQFNSSQVTAVNELQSHEDRYRENFKLLRGIMTKPRDPLAGDPTPRDETGECVLNPNAHGTNVNGYPLFPKTHAREPKVRTPEKMVTGQIGVPDHKYLILGNKEEDIMKASAQPEDLFKKAQMDLARKSGKKADEAELARCKTEIKANRQAVKLAQSIAKMKITMDKKQAELDFLDTKKYATMGRH